MTVSDYNTTYTPLLIVKDTHLIPHLNAQLTIQSNTFDITYDSQWNSYTRSLLPIPLIIMSAGLLALTIFWMAICCRACFPACKCMPKVERMNPLNANLIERTEAHMPVFRRVRFFYVSFFVFALFAFGADQSVIFGSNGLIDGVNTSKDSLNYLQSMFDTLVSDGDELSNEGELLYSDYYNAINVENCQEAEPLMNYYDDYVTYVSQYQDLVDPVPGECTDASNNLDKYGVQYKNSSMWSLYSLVLVALGLYLIGLFFKSIIFLKVSMVYVYLLMWALIIMCGVEMVILMGLADFCMAPATYIQNVVPTSITDITTYYATCVGANPLSDSIDSIVTGVQQEQAYITGLLNGDCAGNPYLIDAQSQLNTILNIVSNITVTIDCPPTQAQLDDVLNNGLCDQSFRGLYTIWVGQYISVTCLFFATIFVALLYQFFDPHWDINPAHIKKSNSNLAIYDENNNGLNKPSDSSNEIYYNTSSLHTTGDNNLVGEDHSVVNNNL